MSHNGARNLFIFGSLLCFAVLIGLTIDTVGTLCFMNVKPRLPRRDINCVNCGECITACHKELGQGNGLFSFSCPKPDLSKEKNKTVDLTLNKQSFIRR